MSPQCQIRDYLIPASSQDLKTLSYRAVSHVSSPCPYALKHKGHQLILLLYAAGIWLSKSALYMLEKWLVTADVSTYLLLDYSSALQGCPCCFLREDRTGFAGITFPEIAFQVGSLQPHALGGLSLTHGSSIRAV